MNYDFQNALLPAPALNNGIKRLRPAFKEAEQASYENLMASSALLDDFDRINRAGALAKHMKDVDLLILVGIGGSNLGTMAVAEAVLGTQYTSRNTPRILYADTPDPAHVQDIVSALQRAMDEKKNIIINVVSKSGTTTETVAIFTVLLNVFKQQANYRDKIVVTTDKGSRLWDVGKVGGFHVLEIPKLVGGRYSVFSPVGLFPLAVLGIDIQELIKGAITARSYCLQPNRKNPAACGAIALAHHLKKGKNIHDTFVFVHQLEGVGRWYRQLLAESIGKEKTLSGKKVNTGITPTVSVGSVDLHSMGQLYLSGPLDKITTFIDVENEPHVPIPLNKEFALLVDNIQGKSLKDVMGAILKGTKLSYLKRKMPFISITVPRCDEKAIGELLQMKMLETIYLGHLLNVNPFDQEGVEKYKRETRRILAGR